jgi:hypothetical protein
MTVRRQGSFSLEKNAAGWMAQVLPNRPQRFRTKGLKNKNWVKKLTFYAGADMLMVRSKEVKR